jgi:hypothetical protein
MAGSQTSRTQDASPLEHTRKMLDELDALMERMMALPVNSLDNPPPEASFSGPTVSATMTLLDSSSLEPANIDAPKLQASNKDAATGDSTREQDLESALFQMLPEGEFRKPPLADALDSPDCAPELGLLPDELMPASLLAMSSPPVEARPMPEWSFGTICLQPLYLVNRSFDRFTMLFDPLGKWFRHSVGRNVLGITGLVFIGLAIAWLIKDWLGWGW